jgi:hypothetical protein
MAAPPDWTRCQAALQQVIELTDAAHRAAVVAADSGLADEFSSSCVRLNLALSTAQPMVASMSGVKPVPAEVRRLLDGIESRLQALQEFTARQDAATRRALGVLFPADQVREYSRLGSRLAAYGGGRAPSSGVLKA